VIFCLPRFRESSLISSCRAASVLDFLNNLWELSRTRVVVPALQATWACGIDSLEFIPGLLKSLKIPSLKDADAHCTYSLVIEDYLKNGVEGSSLIAEYR
jgi:hypothetical protein